MKSTIAIMFGEASFAGFATESFLLRVTKTTVFDAASLALVGFCRCSYFRRPTLGQLLKCIGHGASITCR